MLGRFVFAVIVAGLLLSLLYLSVINPAAAEQLPVDPCAPDGYNIGTIQEPICKLTPTGCIYGDSMTKDVCDKMEIGMSHNIEVTYNEDLSGK